jgi:hypothetical protein
MRTAIAAPSADPQFILECSVSSFKLQAHLADAVTEEF